VCDDACAAALTRLMPAPGDEADDAASGCRNGMMLRHRSGIKGLQEERSCDIRFSH
jgi:hypothetical protein